MTDPGEKAETTPPSDASSGTEPTAAGHDAPGGRTPAEPARPIPPSYPDFAPPPAYGGYQAPPGYAPQDDTPPNYPPPGFAPPDQSGTGYPPPPPGFGAPQGAPPFGAPQYGAPQYGAPQFGGPPPGYPPAPPYGAVPGYGGYGPPPQPGTNSLAIGSLIAALLGVLCGIGSIIGIVLGFVALNQIKQSNQGGHGLAVAGIAVGALTLVFSFILAFAML